MPTYKPYTKRHLDMALKEIEAAIYTVVGKLDIRAWCTREPIPFAQRQTGAEKTLAVGDTWGALFDCAWFHFTGACPRPPQAKRSCCSWMSTASCAWWIATARPSAG